MAKQLNVKIGFDADISQAKQKITELQNALTNVAKMPGNSSSLFDDTQIRKASKAALELQQHLQNAVNVETGKLDLSRFSSSLKASNRDLQTYASTLMSIGPNGQQAFMQLAQAIATADAPVTRINNKLKEMGVSLANTARWQISSSILHGFMGSIQKAYGYAQDLNKSLNEIRIVTGQNVDQMTKFASVANRAAKQLSTTTTDYTNASLIYYQQGLSDEEVQKRTEITIKMANAAGQSAEVVSDQLTAVWNNFDNGTKSLEYYADVMTALGASTASSTDEIAGGLEKFAAIGETIGLSYEYAASALATITSNTRQSADVVGTALKTIFARIQGLSIGETLEDGVNLNKYSEALQKVGISIFEQNGELKKMDDILDEMGARWQTLSESQQTALAQTIAGVRQYTQLIALMNEWNSGDNDSMMANLETSYNSSGALQEQQDIYAESWEAAQERVAAAAENIYDSLINDEGFIDLLNGIEKILEGVGGLVDGLGGLKGIVLTVGSVFTTIFAQKMPDALSNLRQNIMVITGQSKKVMTEMQSQMKQILTSQIANANLGQDYEIQAKGLIKITEMKQRLALASKNLSASERSEYEQKIQLVELMYEEIAALAKKKAEMEKTAADSKKKATKTASSSSLQVFDDYTKAENAASKLKTYKNTEEGNWKYDTALDEAIKKANELDLAITNINNSVKIMLGDTKELTNDELNALMGINTNADVLASAQQKIEEAAQKVSDEFTEQIKKRADLEGLGTSIRTQASAWEEVSAAVKDAMKNGGRMKDIDKTVDTTKQKMSAYLSVIQKVAKENGIKIHGTTIKNLSKAIEDMNADNIDEVTEKFSKFAEKISGKVDDSIDELDVSIEDLRDTMSGLQFDSDEIDQLEKDATEAADSTRALNDALDNTGGIADEPIESTFKLSTALTQTASVAMSVSSLITNIQSTAAVFADDSATGIEKLGAALSIVMPIMATFNALMELSRTLSEKDKIAKFGQALGEGALALVTKVVTKAKGAETAAVVANSMAWLTNPVGWIAAVIVGLIAVLGGLAAIISVVTKAIDSNSISFEEASKNVEKAKEAYNEAQNSLTELKSALDEIKTNEDPFKDLTKGTVEWNLALLEANGKVLDLINKYPQLIQYMEESSQVKGLKVISDYGIEQALKAQEEVVRQAQSHVFSTQLTAAKLENDRIGETTWNPDVISYDLTQTVTGNDLQFIIETMASGVTDVSEIIESLKTFNPSWETKETYMLEENLTKNKDALLLVAERYAQNTIKIEANTAALIENTNSKSEKYNNSQYKDFIVASAESGDKRTQAEIDVGNMSNQEVFNAYAKYLEETTGKKTQMVVSGGKATVQQEVAPGVYETVGDKNSLDIAVAREAIINQKAATFSDQEIAEIEKQAEGYIEDAKKIKIDGEALSDEEVEKIALAMFKANQEGTTVDLVNLLGKNGTIDFSQMTNKGLVQNQTGTFVSDKQTYSPEQNQLIKDASTNGATADEIGSYEAALNEKAVIQQQIDQMEEELVNARRFTDVSGLETEIEAKKQALQATQEKIDAQEKELLITAEAGKAASQYGLNQQEVIVQAKQMAKAYDLDAKAAARLAVENQRMNKGVSTLSENWEDWGKELRANDKTSRDWAKTSTACTKAIADLVGASEDLELPEEFFESTKNLNLLEQAAQGSEEAINELGLAVAAAQVEMLEFNNTMYGATTKDVVSLEQFEGWKSTIINGINDLQSSLSGVSIGDNVFEQLGGDAWVTALNEMAMATGMSVAEMNSMLNSMGVEAEVVTTTKDVTTYVPWYRTEEKVTTEGDITTKESHVVAQGLDPVEGQVEVAQINTGDDVGTGGPKITFIGNGNVSNSAVSGNKGGGGGGSKPKKAKETSKSDIVERYKEVEDQLDNVKDAQDKASKSADRLYGAARLKEMDKISKALQKQVQLLKDKKKEAEAYLKLDKAELEKVSAKVGISFNFDPETGDITNYTSEMTKLYDKLHNLEVSANADGNVTEAEQEAIDKVNEDIDLVEEARKQYEDTVKTKEEIEQAIQDAIREQQDINFEKLNYKFELKMEISENSLKWIDYQLGKLEDDFYSAAEAAALFFDISNQEGTKYGQTLEQVKLTTQQFAEAEKMYNTFDKDGNRLISQANYIEAMNQARDSYYDQLAALQEIDDAMMNYYSDTLDKASEELAKYTDQMEHLSGVLEHYNSLMTLMGKEKDYKTMGVVLDGQLKVAEDKLAVSESTYKMYAAEVKKYEDDIENGVYASMTDAEKELFDKEYQAALQKASEAEEEFLSNAEATVEAWKAKMQNELDGFGKDLEKALTGDTSFDWLTTTMERMNSLHEEYLTTTNKIYETNKLMNQAQKEIDKSSNSIAKRKLKDFVEQTKSLQDQTALSKFELDIQQAKYDLLLAEIALEEAQNAKSQVRLQRDSEGNFGYVYTADSSAIDDAQQKLQDAQNNLYNISLEGANKYAEQEVQIRSEMYDTLRELETQYMEGSFASLEEYETARNEAMAYYYDKLEQASNLYNVAISADASASAEHILGQEYLVAQASFGTFGDIAQDWQSRLRTMKSDTDLWKTDVVDYVDNVISKFKNWETFCTEMSKRTSLTDLATQVGNITEKSEELRKQVTDPVNGVIKALKDEFDAVQKVTGEYGNQRTTIQGLIGDIENYIKALDNKQKAEVGDLDKEEDEGEKQGEKQETSSDTSDTNTKQEASELAATTKELVGKIHRGEIGKSGQGWKSSARAAGYSEDAIELALRAINESKQGAGYGYYYDKALELLDSYDTGGYTGNWDGSYGKLAMVHKKELILKEGDTANFLASMEVLERILSIIDLQSANAQYIGAINSPALKSTGQDVLEQNVHIEANFPGATDRNEIEEAFKNIVNLASQYANRK